jgi:3'(2'), 5'-bisphosphate nucleotidase
VIKQSEYTLSIRQRNPLSGKSNMSESPSHLIEQLITVARQAGDAIMAVYATDFIAHSKDDASPVTEADEKAEAIILEGLTRLTPDIPVISEEAAAAGHIPKVGQRYWLVDPLDGTKEFISRNGEFTVNIALIEDRRPVLGIVLAPALGRLYAGAQGVGALTEDAQGRRVIHCRNVPAEGLTVVASRSHGDTAAMDAYLSGRKVASFKSAGSSLKLCLVAAGEADLYPRFGRTMEWDIAAGHAILASAGGRVTTLDGHTLMYGKVGLENPHFVASGL